ncbi:MAG: type II toxin-antitoxin system VapC family toxin [Myxococcota bacterium]
MPGSALLDTGALLALLDRDDRWHQPCVAAFETLRLPVITTIAVLTELFHLLGDGAREHSAAWQLLRSGAVRVAPISDEDLPALETLMMRYRDRPMDLADATLVHLAQRESLSTILTVDNDDFESYRIGAKRRFRVLPGRIGRS